MSLIRPNEQLVTELFAVYVKQQQTWMPHASRAPLPCIRRFTVSFHVSYLQITCSANARTFILARVCATNSTRGFASLRIFSLVTLHLFERKFICIAIVTEDLFYYWVFYFLNFYILSAVEISWISWCKSSRWWLLEETICSWLSNVSTKKFENWKFKVWIRMSSFIERVFFGFLYIISLVPLYWTSK